MALLGGAFCTAGGARATMRFDFVLLEWRKSATASRDDAGVIVVSHLQLVALIIGAFSTAAAAICLVRRVSARTQSQVGAASARFQRKRKAPLLSRASTSSLIASRRPTLKPAELRTFVHTTTAFALVALVVLLERARNSDGSRGGDYDARICIVVTMLRILSAALPSFLAIALSRRVLRHEQTIKIDKLFLEKSVDRFAS